MPQWWLGVARLPGYWCVRVIIVEKKYEKMRITSRNNKRYGREGEIERRGKEKKGVRQEVVLNNFHSRDINY